jgi:hypothetical protein
MSDSQFLDCINLDTASMRQAAQSTKRGRIKAAARQAAAAMFAKPLKHPVNERDIPDLAEIINRRFPDQVEHLVRLADNYLLKSPPTGKLVCGRNPEEEHTLYRAPARNCIRRAEGVHMLARLHHLTGKRKYFAGALRLTRRIIQAMPPLPDGDHVGAFDWHPHSDVTSSHEPGHIAEKLCHALPYLRPHLEPDDALMFAKALLAMAEFCFRTCRYEVPHNITLHMLTGSLLTGLSFPAFKQSAEWVHWVKKRLESDFVTRPFATPDGYFGEGFGYQAVNQNLLLLNLRYLTAAGRKVSPKLNAICEKSFEFAAAILRADGKCPQFADCSAQAQHEHYIHHHEILHLAAAFFGRADFKAAAGTPYCSDPMEYNVWLMGRDGFTWWDSAKTAPPSSRAIKPHDFRKSGFQFFGAGNGLDAHFGLFACAAAHNHAHHDFGGIDIWALGRALLTDPGVTTYGEESFRHERAHNTPVPIRRRPAGPRLDQPDHVRTLFVIHRPDIQAACMEHYLYESHRIRRTVCLISAGSTRRARRDNLPAFWLVVDRVDRRGSSPVGTMSHDFIETYFHFNAPQTRLGRDADTLTCWSNHRPGAGALLRYPADDVSFEHTPRRVRWRDYLHAYEESDSDANIQVTAVVPHRPHYVMDMRFFEGFTGEYGGRVKRPSMAYRYRGYLPFDAAYVLVPFRGAADDPHAKVTGRWTRTGNLSVSVALPTGPVSVRADGLLSDKTRPILSVKMPR